MTARSRHGGRRDRLRELVARETDADRLLVTDLANVRYLTGFTGSNGVLVLGLEPDGDLIGTDGRYRDQVAQEVPDLPALIDRDTVTATLMAAGTDRTAVEASMPVGTWSALPTAQPGAPIAHGLVERLRARKDEVELEHLRRACAITSAALAALALEIRPGISELTLARRLEQLFGELGAQDRAFDSIVATGPHAAIPHHQPDATPLVAGDLLVIDAGARVEGYHADMTRTFVVGADPLPWQAAIHALVEQARASAAEHYLTGADARSVHEVARRVIDEGGHGADFTHGLGHGVGLAIHEAPNVGPRATGSIDADMVITVEPGIYLPGRGGVRIEDTLVITDSGPGILTEAPRDLVVVG